MEQDTQSSQYRRHPPQLYLTHAERENPNEVSGEIDTLSKLTVKKAERFSGKRRDQEANAANRKATGRHNWADRAGKPERPTLKGG
jgi:hypothetical protein